MQAYKEFILGNDFDIQQAAYWQEIVKKFPKDTHAQHMLKQFQNKINGGKFEPSEQNYNSGFPIYNFDKETNQAGLTLFYKDNPQKSKLSNDTGMKKESGLLEGIDWMKWFPYIIIGGALLLFISGVGSSVAAPARRKRRGEESE